MKGALAAAIALLASALHSPVSGQGPARAFLKSARSPFVAMTSRARTQVDCLPSGCPALPVIYDPAEVPTDAYSSEFLGRLFTFMLEVRVRKETPGDLSSRDWSTFQLSLNVLDGYWTCIEGTLVGSDADYTDATGVDRLAARAADECKDKREAAMRRIEFAGPDFHSFDRSADSEKPQAAVSELLQTLERFAVAYHAGRHGVQWDRWAELAPLPKAVPRGQSAILGE